MADGHVQYRFGSFLLDTARRELLHGGKPVIIQALVFDLLAYLVSHSDRVVGKDELLDAVWPGRVITEAAMSQAIMKVRSAVSDDADDPSIIKTIYGKGFRFVAPVEAIEVSEEPGESLHSKTSRPGILRIGVIAAGLVAVAIAVLVVGRFWLTPPAARPKAGADSAVIEQDTHADAAFVPDYPPNTIAVLPFVNMSDDAANEYFSDGISEELLNLLAKIPELRVTSRTSAFSLKGRDIKVSEIARELNVAHVLEGSVRKAGNRVRVTAQLVDARSDAHLWSTTYDRTLDDIFAIQDEIAAAVVDALKLTLLGETPRAQSVDPQAYSLFLQARHLNAQGKLEAFGQSIDLYKRVLEIAPDYARAWRGLAVNYVNQANKGLRSKSESYALAREAINRALIIDPDYARAHAMLGVFSMTLDRDLVAAAPHFSHALSLQPNDVVLLSYASSFMLRLGRLDEVIAFRERDVIQDPLDPIGYNNLAFVYAMAGKPDEAIATTKTLLMLAPKYNAAHYTWAKALIFKGEYEAAIEIINREPSELWRLVGQAIASFALGRTSESDVALNELIQQYSDDWAYYIAVVFAYRGESDRAFDWLHKAIQNSDASMTYAAIEPLLANLHDDSRWLPFLQSIGMAPEQLAAIEFRSELPDLNW
jgi:TolB-like protein/DNA-binding winged helix-turn-helix (wHTH) protein/Tfp pilus assembly protein PilF